MNSVNSVERFKEARPYIIVFLISAAAFAASMRNPWWFIVAAVIVTAIYLLARLGDYIRNREYYSFMLVATTETAIVPIIRAVADGVFQAADAMCLLGFGVGIGLYVAPFPFLEEYAAKGKVIMVRATVGKALIALVAVIFEAIESLPTLSASTPLV
jgi:hypothetical protein